MPNSVPFAAPDVMLNVYCLEMSGFNSLITIVICWFEKILSFEPSLSYSSARKVRVKVVALVLTSITPGRSTCHAIGSNSVQWVVVRPPPYFVHLTSNLGNLISCSFEPSLYFMYSSMFRWDRYNSSVSPTASGLHDSGIVIPCKYIGVMEGAASDLPLVATKKPRVPV